MFGYDVFGAPALGFAASNTHNDIKLKMNEISGLFWQGKSAYTKGGGKEYSIKDVMVEEPEQTYDSKGNLNPWNGQMRNVGIKLRYVWPDTSNWVGHYFEIKKYDMPIWTSEIIGDNPIRHQAMDQAFRQKIIDAWDSATFVPETCNTTDTYLGLKTGCTDGGSRCTDNSGGLTGGEKVLVQSGGGYGKTYSEETIPAGIIICDANGSNFTPCTSNQEKVLGSYIGTAKTGTDGKKIKTTGLYKCIAKSGCPDQHNIDYKEASLGYRDDYAACGSDCITGASKTLLSAGNGSCILKIDEWNDGVAENQAGQKSMKLALGKSGHVGTSIPYKVAFTNGDSSLNYKPGSNGSKDYATEAEATDAFNRAAGRRKAILNPPEIVDDDGVIDCTDSLRQSKSDGSCDANCLSGHDYNTSGLCEKVESKGFDLTTFGFLGGIGLLAVLVLK